MCQDLCQAWPSSPVLTTTSQTGQDRHASCSAPPLPHTPQDTSPSTPWDPEPDAPSRPGPSAGAALQLTYSEGLLRRLWSPRWHGGQAEGSIDICDDAWVRLRPSLRVLEPVRSREEWERTLADEARDEILMLAALVKQRMPLVHE